MPGDDDYQGERILVLTEWRWDRILRAAKIMKEYLQGPGKHLNVENVYVSKDLSMEFLTG